MKLFNMPLGVRFRYAECPDRTFVLLSYGGNGLVADAPIGPARSPLQGLYSAAESREEFEGLEVEYVPVTEVPT